MKSMHLEETGSIAALKPRLFSRYPVFTIFLCIVLFGVSVMGVLFLYYTQTHSAGSDSSLLAPIWPILYAFSGGSDTGKSCTEAKGSDPMMILGPAIPNDMPIDRQGNDNDAPNSSIHTANRYIVIIDAGSSGSRLFIYSWKTLDNNALPRFRLLWSMTMWRGLSSFATTNDTETRYTSLSHYMKSLFDFALFALDPEYSNSDNDRERKSKKSLASNVPFYILATAGMRMLSQDLQDSLKKDILSIYQGASLPFIFNESHIQSITGEQEGIYGWLSVNYMMNRLEPISEKGIPDKTRTVGFMDLGGASLQLAYELDQDHIDLMQNGHKSSNAPNSESYQPLKQNDNVFTVFLSNSFKKKVFVTSLTGLGTNEARRRYIQNLPDWRNLSAEYIRDPCVPFGAKEANLTFNNYNGSRSIQGIGGFHACMNQTRDLLNTWAKSSPSLPLPPLPTPMTIVGISEFFNTMHDVFDFGGVYDPVLFSIFTKKFCHSPWDKLKHHYHVTHDPDYYNDLKLKKQCFKSAWVMTLLHELFHIPMERPPYQSIELITMKNVQDMAISWTLGAAIVLYHHHRQIHVS
jgi:Golgi apyrase